MLSLEKYKGEKSRHICPSCKSKNDFTRFIDETGNYLADEVGICNRASKCGYSYTAKQFFVDNPDKKIGLIFGKGKGKSKNSGRSEYWLSHTNASQTPETGNTFDYIAPEHLKTTLGNYDRNAFVRFLLNLFPDSDEEIQDILKTYFVGTYKGYTCFPQIDRQMRICKATLIRFDPASGKRRHGKGNTSSLVSKLRLKENFNYKQVFFGEHLLTRFADKPVAIVESQKSAIVGGLCLPKMVWMATGSKQWLNVGRLERLGNRKIMLFPDADGYDRWKGVATDAQRQGLDVKVSTLIETLATEEEKSDGFDIADYLIRQARSNPIETKVEQVVEQVVEPIVEQVKQSEARVEQSEARVEPTIIDFANPCTLDQATVDALCNRF
jgi:hypothetical protein